MEYLEGEPLRHALKTRGALPVAECTEILQQAARGLNAAHKLGIIHRDLKPDNIFLTRGDEGELIVKVVDFGIAKLRESAAHTLAGTVLGTPPYMSYEQASGMKSDELDARSDIYSLGVVVYEMLTGRVPFQSDTPVGYLRKHLQDDPPPFRAVKPDLSALPQLESVVRKALTKDRDQRYGSVLEFARELTSAAQPSRTAQSPVTIPPTRIVPPSALPKPAHLPIATENPSRVKPPVIGLVLLASIAAGIWYFYPSAKHPPAHVTSQSSDTGKSPAPADLGRTPGAVKVNPKDGLKYVWIPPGSFRMGCSPGDNACADDEKPLHHVTITKGFWLGQTEVTVGAYKRFTAATGGRMPPEPDIYGRPLNPGWGDEGMPILDVTWDDAQAYCRWAGWRLPTEAEWEYAARAGSAEARYGSPDKAGWFSENSGQQTHPVGKKQANGFGLYDILGNVWEWVNDWYDDNYYRSSPSQDPAGPASGELHVLRGGSWVDLAWIVRVSIRSRIVSPAGFDSISGFRCGGEVFPP